MRRALDTFFAFGIALIAFVFLTARAVWDWLPRIEVGSLHLLIGAGSGDVRQLPARRAQFKAFVLRMAQRKQPAFADWRTALAT